MALTIPPFVAPFDTETSGVDLDSDRIVTAFVGKLDTASGELIYQREWLINPGVEIPQGAIDVHGVTNERAQADGTDPAIAIAEIIDTLIELTADGTPAVAYNGRFDFTLLDREARRHDLVPFEPVHVIDPLIVDKQLDPYRRGKRTLQVVSDLYGCGLVDAHDAASDAIAAGRLAVKMLHKLSHIGSLDELMNLQRVWALQQAASLQDYFRRKDPTVVIEGRWPVVPFEPRPAADELDEELLLTASSENTSWF